MNTKMESNFERFDAFSFLSFKFASVVVLFGLVLYFLTQKRKKTTSTINGRVAQFPLSKYLLCAIEHTLGVAKLPAAEILMKFGDFFHFNYFQQPTIVVSNNYETIKNMMNSPDWTDRPKIMLVAIRNGGDQDRGLMMSSGDVWKKTRRYTVKSLSQLGLGKKNNLEYTTQEELKTFLDNLEKVIIKSDNNVPVRNLFSLPTINVIWRIVEGTAFSADDPTFHKIVTATDNFAEVNFYQFVSTELLGSLAVKAVPVFSFHKILQSMAVMTKYFTDVISRQRLNIEENGFNDTKENFTDNFLRQMTSKSKIGMEDVFNVENLMATLLDLFEAGVDTTSSTLEVAIMHLAMHPDVQQKMRKEIKTVIGDDEQSYYSNKANLPYTQAVIQEVHRMSSIVPFNLRSAISDCYINDTFIKKGTMAAINLYSIHYNEISWGDPYNFRPERFIGNDGCLDSTKLRQVLSFGAGKRVCLGENVANISIFTILIGILQKYTVHLANPNEDLGMETNSTFTSRAKPFHAKFVPVEK